MTHDENYKSDTSNYSKAPNPIISHDELLAIIDDNFSQCGDDCESCRRDNASWFALRAVVELHKPIEVETEGGTFTICENCVQTYPCPTIQAIEKELG